MRASRALLIVLLAVLAPVIAAQPASADPYPIGTPSGTVSVGTVRVGGMVTFSGTGFAVGESISIDVTYSNNAAGGSDDLAVPAAIVRSVTADTNGSFSTTLRLTQVGTAILTATGSISGVTVSAIVRVLPRPAERDSFGGGLALTGNDGDRLKLQIGGAIVAIMIGAALVWFATRRRRPA